MENIYEFPDRNAIEQEAGEWLIRLDADTPLSVEELNTLKQWLNRSPVHREELGSLINFYGKMNILTELAVPLGKQDTKQKPSINKESHRAPLSVNYLSTATAICALFIAIITFFTWESKNTLIETNDLYATVVGQQQTTTLSDGSVIQLNTNTQVRVEYTKNYRNVYLLQGEAYFAVAKNPGMPFMVYAGNGRIKAVGTAFSVYLKDNDINITVTEGRVALASAKEPALPQQKKVAEYSGKKTHRNTDTYNYNYTEIPGLLNAGQGVVLKSGILSDSLVQTTIDSIQTIEQENLANRLSWRNGLLTFVGEPLEEVVDEISRYTTVSIEIIDPNLRSIRIGGQFRIGDIEAMLDALETNFGLQVKRLGDNHIQLAATKK